MNEDDTFKLIRLKQRQINLIEDEIKFISKDLKCNSCNLRFVEVYIDKDTDYLIGECIECGTKVLTTR